MPCNCFHVTAAIIIPNAGGLINSMFLSKKFSPVYDRLVKPSWCPKPWMFGPAWVGVYSTIGYASYLVYKECSPGFSEGSLADYALCMYGMNLSINLCWAPVFFEKCNMKAAFVINIIVDATAVATAYMFYKVNKPAGCLIIPYLLWLGFETTLSYVLMKKNPLTKDVTGEKKK